MMDVDIGSFWELLPTLVKHIAASDFIAIDLELSGIPTKARFGGKMTMQQHYEDLRAAANEYHILQVGFTCVERDMVGGKYLCRPFNFNLNPLIPSAEFSPQIERKFSYSTSAVEFLLSHGYRMDAPFIRGIPYLTETEEQIARRKAMEKWDPELIPDMFVRDDDKQAQAFLERFRIEILTWKQTGVPEKEVYNATGPNLAPLSRFQKRLVHQTVRSEHPDLETFSRQDFVTVKWRNRSNKLVSKDAVQNRVSKALFTQIGFRWIADAIAGKDISDLDPNLCAQKIEGEPHLRTSGQFIKRLEELKAQISSRTNVIVGHNCLIDLVYLYKTFFGDLPQSMDEFQNSISRLFPFVIDTKWLATSELGGKTSQNSQLWQLDESLTHVNGVLMDIPAGYGQYTGSTHFHEAGFDSFVTARVFLRLAAELSQTESKRISGTALEPSFRNAESVRERRIDWVGRVNDETSRGQRYPGAKGPFSHLNPFEILQSFPEYGSTVGFEEQSINPRDASSTEEPCSDPQKRVADIQKTCTPAIPARRGLLPDWKLSFWDHYKNKLRAYRTEDEVWDLSRTIN